MAAQATDADILEVLASSAQAVTGTKDLKEHKIGRLCDAESFVPVLQTMLLTKCTAEVGESMQTASKLAAWKPPKNYNAKAKNKVSMADLVRCACLHGRTGAWACNAKQC